MCMRVLRGHMTSADWCEFLPLDGKPPGLQCVVFQEERMQQGRLCPGAADKKKYVFDFNCVVVKASTYM